MKIEGVTFVENAVKSMTKEEFIERHIKGGFYQFHFLFLA